MGPDALAREIARVVKMRDRIAHRGPDNAGLWHDEGGRVILGHRRLSIVDLSPAGHQPMSNEDASIWLTFNGEIYNHAEVHREHRLDERHQFRSRSDTEVMLHLYEERQLGMFELIDGMFAFALWDGPRERMVLARDRMGKKPLYYAAFGGKLLFASEIKAILEHPEVPRQLDLEALDAYLTFSNVPEPLTLFQGIRKLPAAHFMVCDKDGNLKIERYWSPLDAHPWPERSDSGEAVERVRHLLKQAVRKRLMADVPIGAFLSGGVDSSTNVALMSELTSEPLRTFTVDFTGYGEAENFHDVPWARRVTSMFGCKHTEVPVTSDEARAYLPEMVLHQDEPLGDPACLPMHFVSRAAKEAGVKVVLVGEGSDEVFGGYSDFERLTRAHDGRWTTLKRLPHALRRAIYFGARFARAPAGRVDVLRRAAYDEPLYMGLDVVFWDTEKERLFTRKGRSLMKSKSADRVNRYYREILGRRPDADFLQQMSYVELRNRLPELLLMRVDKFSMAHSLEARAPFLDYELSEYVLSLPASLKMADGRTKIVLKDAAAAWLPKDLLERKKQGFRVPLPEWLRNELGPWAEEVLRTSSLRRLGIIDFDYVMGLWSAHRDGKADNSFDLWSLINLSAWYERWFARV
ncbi:Asparagine synthetase [Labilithrix luteola]|uniref:asparagine synthase (glutamine-hydrolyzing) n=1 Tax=Labilithrix luteola TaxID=1391654 RepID=A0A0K1PZ40_9BACT|nr:Asparagine synthetase [Labilithrix luteola]